MSATLPGDVRDLLAAVLAERAMHAAIALRAVLRLDGTPHPADLEWETAWLREQLAEHSPAGYNTGPWPGVPVDRDQHQPKGGGR